MRVIRNIFGVVGLLLGLAIGGVTFLLSLLTGLAIRTAWIAYVAAVILATSLTLYSAAHPESFRFGPVDLKVHDGFYIAGIPSLYANLGKNLLLAYLGALTGLSARQRYNQGRSNKSEHAIAP
jgi:hypothetical protein